MDSNLFVMCRRNLVPSSAEASRSKTTPNGDYTAPQRDGAPTVALNHPTTAFDDT